MLPSRRNMEGYFMKADTLMKWMRSVCQLSEDKSIEEIEVRFLANPGNVELNVSSVLLDKEGILWLDMRSLKEDQEIRS